MTLNRNKASEWIENSTSFELRCLLLSAIERLPARDLEALLEGWAHLESEPNDNSPHLPGLAARVEEHVSQTLAGRYRGDFIIRNAHGMREPVETERWLAKTTHLMNLALKEAEKSTGETDPLRALLSLVREVDKCVDEYVTFEDSAARVHFHGEIERAKRVLAHS